MLHANLQISLIGEENLSDFIMQMLGVVCMKCKIYIGLDQINVSIHW